MAYIDSELNKRRLNAMSSAAAGGSGVLSTSGPDSGSTDTAKAAKPVERQPATLGKILEVDLGNEARDRNVVRTEQARRRLDGEDVEDESVTEGKTKKIRIGRDGKPWRGRKRRTSEDIRRDQLVEEVLRENRRMFLPYVVHRIGCILIFLYLQSRFMKSLNSLRFLRKVTGKQMTALQKHSGANSWMLCRNASGRNQRHRRLQEVPEERKRKSFF